MKTDRDYSVIVVGGGHAGIEASSACARMGFRTLLITQNPDTIGKLSCNPAIGGQAKGNIVREIDALGGEMGKLIDRSLIQFRMLNKSKGPAVQSPRAQADKYLYSALAKQTLEGYSNLTVFMDTVTDIMTDDHNVCIGVKTQRGNEISSYAVVLTTGTFMNGRIFIGDYDREEGRLGEESAQGLGQALSLKGFEVGRLKTGTPARIKKSSVDFNKTELQEGDETIYPFSFLNEEKHPDPSGQLPCYITYTNSDTHRIIRDNINRSPLYGGKIVGKGPRYCPSIEDKVMRFPDRERHQIFIEPEGAGTDEMYLNGLSSSLPEKVQLDFIHSIKGLENAVMVRPGYAVEYDYLNPIQLKNSLESGIIANLFIAGQTNGSSGYEEAGCQGLIAGINAAQKLLNKEPLVLSRAEAYTGVLIDDLVTKGTEEPYRMFTGRAEYRLRLRHDNADARLTLSGYEVGLVSEERISQLKKKYSEIDSVSELLHHRSYNGKNAYEALKNPEVTMEMLFDRIPELKDFSDYILNSAGLDIKYEGYISRQDRQIDKFSRLEKIKIPLNINWDELKGISKESIEKFKKVRPETLAQASRISGVRVCDIPVLLAYLKGNKCKG